MAAAFALGFSAVALGGLPQPIYFFTDTATPINSHNPLVIRPSGFLLFQDGQWVLQDLHWTGWGSSVARASGISNSSNDIPNAAQGKRIKTWADVTLSNPGRFRGHEVYRCFALTVPPPASDMFACLAQIGSGWELAALDQTEFLSPDQKVWCEFGSPQSFCFTGGQAGNQPQRNAFLDRGGKVTLCYVPVPSLSAACAQNWDTSAPILKVGQETEADNVLCKSKTNGITCTLASGSGKGKGFLINSTSARRVGP
ncbi:MAG: hypothetical protein ACRDPA_03450 [Solirubrobacteraceae bacterium]